MSGTVDIVPEITETAEEFPMPTATKTLWFHRDHLGTPRAVTNENGDVESLHDYTPFGIELPIIQPPRPDGHPSEGGELSPNTRQFTGQELINYPLAKY